MDAICPVHGECEHKYHSKGKARPKALACLLCCRHRGLKRRKRKISKYVQARAALLKFKAIMKKGGACQRCGYDKCPAAMDFHHRDPSQKEFTWSRMQNRSWGRIVSELDKCDLLCANCHREAHWSPDTTQKHVTLMKNRDSTYMGDRQLLDFDDILNAAEEFLARCR